MDWDEAIRSHLGRSWSEVEDDATSYIERAAAAVVRWEWMAWSEKLWEIPEPRTGEEEPPKVLKVEPPPEKRERTVLFGYDEAERIVVGRRFKDHWEGPDGETRHGVLWIESVWAEDVLLRFEHERWGKEHYRLKLGSVVHSVRDDTERIVEVKWWFGERRQHRRTSYEWNGDRVERAITEDFEQDPDEGLRVRERQRLDYEHDDEGLLRVRWHNEYHRYFPEAEGDSGVAWYRRSPQALRQARKLVDRELPIRIQAWVERVAPPEPVYALGIVYSVDAPELPPALGLGTLAELRAWQEQCGDVWDFRMQAFNPGEFALFEGVPPELSDDPALQDAYALLNQDWQLAESDREPRTTLRRCAKTLLQLDWSAILTPADDFIIIVVEDEIGDDLPQLLRATVPRDVIARLETRGPS